MAGPALIPRMSLVAEAGDPRIRRLGQAVQDYPGAAVFFGDQAGLIDHQGIGPRAVKKRAEQRYARDRHEIDGPC